MSTPFQSEIRIMSFSFPPRGWALCNGQTLSIAQNQALFSLLGITYGGNGTTTFALPNLQGRVPTSMGQGLALGQFAGEESHTLVTAELPAHSHTMSVKATAAPQNAVGDIPAPGKVLAEANAANSGTAVNIYGTGSPSVAFASDSVGNNSGGQPHENRQPYLTLSFCIALQGIFPSRN